jgi:hypothetical protein
MNGKRLLRISVNVRKSAQQLSEFGGIVKWKKKHEMTGLWGYRGDEKVGWRKSVSDQ